MSARQKIEKAVLLLAESPAHQMEAYELLLEAYQQSPTEFSPLEAALVYTTVKPLVDEIENGMSKNAGFQAERIRGVA